MQLHFTADVWDARVRLLHGDPGREIKRAWRSKTRLLFSKKWVEGLTLAGESLKQIHTHTHTQPIRELPITQQGRMMWTSIEASNT